MAGFTTAYGNSVLDKVFRNQALTPPVAVYAGYSSAAGTESSDANYIRQAITFGAAATKAISNTGAVTFPAVAAAENCVECALFTAATAGTQMTDWKALTGGTVALVIGQQARIPVGDYDVSI